MATEGFDVRISLQRLLIGLILAIVPLSILGFYNTSRRAAKRLLSSRWEATSR